LSNNKKVVIVERLPLPARIVRPLGYPSVAGLTKVRQEALRAFWLDGMFAAMASGFADPYYTLYLLSLKASNAQIGLVSTLAQLISALLALPGAAVADRTGQYKKMSLLPGVFNRLLWLVIAAAPFVLKDSQAVWVIMIGLVGLAGLGALGNAAWTALSADLVPARLRGGYFASRNIISQFVGLLAIPAAGQLIYWIGEPTGYQVNLLLAFGIACLSLYYYSRLPEHPADHVPDRFSTRQALHRIFKLPIFLRFMIANAILQLGVNIGAPFINVFMAEEIDFNVATIGFVTTVGTFTTLFGMRIMGRLHDRFGITWVMRSGLLLPLVPVAWLWVREPWQAYLVNGFAAVSWAGYNLGAFNLLLLSTPNEHRPRYIAMHTTVISTVAAIGPFVGGWLLDVVGFTTVFSLSGIVRALGLIVFFALVREPEAPAEPDEVGPAEDES
jgi:MFS family permease